MFHEEDGQSARAVDLHNFCENRGDQQRGEAERGFIQHEEFRAAHEGAADGEHLLFAAGEGAGYLLHAFLEAREGGEDGVHFGTDLFFVAHEVGAHFEIFEDAEVGEHHAAFGHMGEAASDNFMGRQASDVFAFVQDFAGLGFEQAGDGLEGGGLAGAVGADEGDDAAGRDGQGDAVQRVDGTVTDRQIVDLEQRRNQASAPR